LLVPTVNLSVNASGAAAAAARGDVIVIVDVIDMSTTLEAAIDAGALAIYGAAPDSASPPVPVDPTAVGYKAGLQAIQNNTSIVLVGEPRVGTDSERLGNMSKTVAGLKKAGARLDAVLPNIGSETPKLHDMRDKVVVAATGTGGVAFDAAVKAGAPAVLTGTVARTMLKKGPAPARAAASRACRKAKELGVTGITVVAASGNSLEDILAAEYIARIIIETFTL